MLRNTLVRTIRDNKGPLYVEVQLTPGGDPSEVQAVKSDVISAYQWTMGNDETGMRVDFIDGGMVLTFDHTGETSGQ